MGMASLLLCSGHTGSWPFCLPEQKATRKLVPTNVDGCEIGEIVQPQDKIDGITLDEEKAKRHALMYIESNSNQFVTRNNRKTDEKWMKFLVDRKLFFNNKVRAQHAIEQE
ncbi:unnamed protein product [Caenorhabditis nigoni]